MIADRCQIHSGGIYAKTRRVQSNFIDGYFTDANGDISWAHKDENDKEWNSLVAENAKGGGPLVFGRIT